MLVAHIADQLTPYRLHVMTRLSRELAEAKFLHILTHRVADPASGERLAPPADVELTHRADVALEYGSVRGPNCGRLFEHIRDTLVSRGVGLVILNGYNDATRVRLMRWACGAGVPLLLAGDSNIHCDAMLPAWKRLTKRLVLSRLLGDCAGFMPMGSAGEAYFRRYAGGAKPMFRFPYEPDYAALQRRDDEGTKAFATRHRLSPDRRRFLAVARLVPEKRFDVLLDAFERVEPSLPAWDLVIVGDGPMKQELMQRVARLSAGRVAFLGALPWSDVTACYHACDALVHASDREPWGVVINEAVAARLPVIATDVCGAAIELVRDGMNGVLVPPGDAGALAQAMTRVADDAERERMRSRCDEALSQWREAADPVEGVRRAVRTFAVK